MESDRIESDRMESVRMESHRIESDRIESVRIESDRMLTIIMYSRGTDRHFELLLKSVNSVEKKGKPKQFCLNDICYGP